MVGCENYQIRAFEASCINGRLARRPSVADCFKNAHFTKIYSGPAEMLTEMLGLF